MLAYEVALSFSVDPCQIDRALPFDVPHDLRYRMLRRYGDHHANVIGHQMPFFYPALRLTSQLSKYLTKMSPQFFV